MLATFSDVYIYLYIGWFSFGLWFLMPLSNISVISSWSVLLVKEIGVPGENHRTVVSH